MRKYHSPRFLFLAIPLITLSCGEMTSSKSDSLSDEDATKLQLFAADFGSADLSAIVAQGWNAHINERLPARVHPDGGVRVQWIDAKNFGIRQNLWIDDQACRNQKIWTMYRIALNTRPAGPGLTGVNPVWRVDSYDVQFAGGHCRDLYRNRIWDALKANAGYLEDQLKALNKGNKSNYYLSRSDSEDKVFVHWGDPH